MDKANAKAYQQLRVIANALNLEQAFLFTRMFLDEYSFEEWADDAREAITRYVLKLDTAETLAWLTQNAVTLKRQLNGIKVFCWILEVNHQYLYGELFTQMQEELEQNCRIVFNQRWATWLLRTQTADTPWQELLMALGIIDSNFADIVPVIEAIEKVSRLSGASQELTSALKHRLSTHIQLVWGKLNDGGKQNVIGWVSRKQDVSIWCLTVFWALTSEAQKSDPHQLAIRNLILDLADSRDDVRNMAVKLAILPQSVS